MASRRFPSPVCYWWFGPLGVALACAPSASQDDSPGPSGPGGATSGPNGTAGSNAAAGTNGTAGASGGTVGASGAAVYGGFATVGGWPAVGGMASTGGRPAVTLPYRDDFEDGVMDQWIRLDDSDINATPWPIVVDSTSASNHVLQLASGSKTWEVGGSYEWRDVVFQVRLRLTSTSGYAFVAVRWERVAGDDNYYYLQIQPGSKPKIRARYGGSTTDPCTGTTNFAGTVGTWYTVAVTAQGSTISASIDGTPVCSGTNSSIAAGGIALGSDGVQVIFDDVSVTAL
jgi:hypothetical protein